MTDAQGLYIPSAGHRHKLSCRLQTPATAYSLEWLRLPNKGFMNEASAPIAPRHPPRVARDVSNSYWHPAPTPDPKAALG
jgi:hypothetical protein